MVDDRRKAEFFRSRNPAGVNPDAQWSNKMFRIKKGGVHVGTVAEISGAIRAIKDRCSDDFDQSDAASKVEQLQVGDEVEVVGGFQCERIRDVTAPVLDPVQAARNRGAKPDEN